MKDLLITFIIGIFVGGFIITGVQKQYGILNPCSTDTVYCDTSKTIVKDSVISKIPSEIIKSLDSVTIDTINTMVNGKIIDSKYKIIFK